MKRLKEEAAADTKTVGFFHPEKCLKKPNDLTGQNAMHRAAFHGHTELAAYAVHMIRIVFHILCTFTSDRKY